MMVAARQGRELQRYSASTGGRIVVGCIPYRVRDDNGEVEVLVICSRKKGASAGVLFPKGGWELDESMDEAPSDLSTIILDQCEREVGPVVTSAVISNIAPSYAPVGQHLQARCQPVQRGGNVPALPGQCGR